MSKKCVVNRNDNGDITSVEVVNLSYTPNTDNIKFNINDENQSGIDVSEAIKLNNNNPLNLAPNGKPSILYNTYKEMGYSEEETIKLVSEVYSERFRNFFGDWLNNPENSSKVVDENGQPKIVWSGHVSSTITSNINGAQFQGYRIYGNEYNSFKQDGEKPQDYRFSNTALFVEDKKLALTYSTGIDAFNTSESFMQKYAPKDSFLEPVFLNIRKYEEVEEVSNKIIPRIDGSIEEGIDGFYGGNRAPYKDFKTWAILDENQVLNAKSPDYINNDVILLNNVVKVLSNKGLTSDVYLMTNDEIVEKLKQLGISENIARELVLKHGSPHKFDKFSTEKIGTGEGNQAFGWGLYFTDLESIAKNYSDNENLIERHLNSVYEFGVPDRFYQIPENKRKSKENLIKYINEQIKGFEGNIFQQKEWNKLKNSVESYNPYIYQVSLHKGKTPDQYTFIEWDNTVSEEVFKKINDLAISKNDVIIKMLSEGINTKNIEGSALYKNLSRQLGSDKAASLFLLEAGIDGIKYPAESISRGATSDTARGFNYVVFDDSAITIENVTSFSKSLIDNGLATVVGGFYRKDTRQIFINKESNDVLNTTIHEFSHPMIGWLIENRRDLFEAGIKLLKENKSDVKKYIDRVNKLYPDLKENSDAYWEEVMAELIANNGVEIINREKKSDIAKWLESIWNAFKNMVGITGYTAEDVSNMTVKEFAYAVNAEMFNEEKLDSLLRVGRRIGFDYDTNLTARERFDIPKLKRISAGSDRIVYELDDNKVIKIAKTARGLMQNIYEGSHDLVEEELLPDIYERGLNYVIVEKVPPIKARDLVPTYDVEGDQIGTEKAEKMFADFSKFSQIDFDSKSQKLIDTLYKYGMFYILNREVLFGDFSRKANWGIKNGKPIHLDGGTFAGTRLLSEYRGKSNLEDEDFKEVYNRSKSFKKIIGDRDRNTMFSLIDNNDLDYSGNIKSEVLAEIQAEREAIKSEAQANGTFMKAPNGNATNLNEAQWIDVRTKRFKDWFGDWQNDPENSSKVVDENGEPLVVYHGTTYSKFYSFKENNIGIFFTDSKQVATGYAADNTSRVMSVFLDIKNPLINSYSDYWEKIFLEPHKKIDIRFDVFEVLDGYEKIQVIKNDGEVNFWSLEELMEDINKNKDDYPSDIIESIDFYIEDAKKYGEEKYATIKNYFNEKGEYIYPEKIDHVVATTLRDSDKDGLIFKNISDNTYRTNIIADVFALQNPNQIKSATENVGTYSANNNDIRYSLESTANINVVENDYIESELFKDISSIPFITKEQSLGVYKSIYTEGLDYWKDSDVKC